MVQVAVHSLYLHTLITQALQLSGGSFRVLEPPLRKTSAFGPRRFAGAGAATLLAPHNLSVRSPWQHTSLADLGFGGHAELEMNVGRPGSCRAVTFRCYTPDAQAQTGSRLIKHARYYWLLLPESSSDAATIWSHVREDRSIAVADRLREPTTGSTFRGEREGTVKMSLVRIVPTESARPRINADI